MFDDEMLYKSHNAGIHHVAGKEFPVGFLFYRQQLTKKKLKAEQWYNTHTHT